MKDFKRQTDKGEDREANLSRELYSNIVKIDRVKDFKRQTNGKTEKQICRENCTATSSGEIESKILKDIQGGRQRGKSVGRTL